MQRAWASSLSIVQRFTYSIVIVLCATLLLYPLREVVGIEIIALLYLFPIGINATFWGLRAGLLSAILAFFALNFNFIPPYYTLYVHRTQDVIILVVFLVVAVFISQLVGRLRRSLRLAQAREAEAVCLFDFMVKLASLQSEQAILDVLVRQVQQAVHADRVSASLKLRLENKGATSTLSSELPLQEHPPTTKNPPDLCFSLQLSPPSEGEIQIWRPQKPFSETEKRFLQIFISQAGLALERLRLRHAEIQAKILAESDRLKASLLSSVSHELRTPLAAIKAAISSLNSPSVELDTDSRKELMAMIEEETDHLNLLVGNLLNMSRLEAGALTLERSWSRLEDIVRSATERTRVYSKDHQVVVQFPPGLPDLYVDYLLMEQVLINLINNSLKHSPAGSKVEIVVFPPETDQVRVEVRNQSPAIPPEYLERIFDKFFRLEQPQRVRGIGLGLAICKGIIEAHGGKIWAENRERGIAFVFTVPLQSNAVVSEVVQLKEGEL
ncbi:MAG: DUF4118 domain-containing protein [Anaerolineales bacterium]|nr:DUF4118 domain-containing protein [Anaerolineales bacterium]MCS7247894.1 DUF4118 domain-containing protein [Anaerolineales bacterium]MDW8161704.1 DUF4118 domain-containing protein [Anaerolineales bacterium]MDW8447224.1 DUF4118 domain-containing protein [Anaerolineales bacterium]